MIQTAQNRPKPLGLCWIYCPYPVAAVGLAKILENEAHVHLGHEAPVEESLASIIFCTDDVENLSEGIKRLQQANDSDAPILVFGLRLDLSLARAALQAGARGFIHAAMQPEQIIRALKVAKEGEIVAPRELVEYLIANERPVDLDILSARQREILELVSEGFTNAQIAKRLFLTESTIKQHLRAAYKVLGVSNRVEAARRMR
jgi:DNA-binding NarL/FixJ family response regulator